MVSTRLKSKHQKLILQCYPPGRTGDKKPNASELSYLLYYVSTRRAKLAKVGLFLEKTNRNDVYRARAGNVDVTLDIIKALIERCPEDLNLFSDHVIAILYQILQSNDVALCQHATDVFGSFCKHHDAALFTGDSKYSTSFCDLVQKFVSVASTSEGPNVTQWRMLGMQAAKDVGGSELVATAKGEKLISLMVPLILSTLGEADGAQLADIKTKLDKMDNQKREQGRNSLDDAIDQTEQLQIKAGDALHTFFDTIGGVQLRVATRNCVRFVLKTNPSEEWSTTLINTISRWTPVQLRFVVLTMLVDMFVGLPLDDVSNQRQVARLIESLLSSNVSMVGLSVMDILRSLTSQQHALIRNDGEGSRELVATLRDCIASIATHIYYADQISNMVAEMLARCRHEDPARTGSSTNLQGLANGASPATAAAEVLVNDLKNIDAILQVSSSQSAAGIEMNKVPLQAWEGSQSMVHHENRQIREAFATAFLTYLQFGVAENDQHLKLHKNFNVAHGTAGRFSLKLYFAATDRQCSRGDFIIIAHLLVGMVENLGVNAIARALPFTMMMQDVGLQIEHEEVDGYYLEQGVAINSICLLVLGSIGNSLGLGDLTQRVNQLVERRQANGTWYQCLDIPLKHQLERDLMQKRRVEFQPVDAIDTQKSQALTREELDPLIKITDFPDDLIHLLLDEAPISDESPGTDTTNDSMHAHNTDILITQARSLKQLRSGYAHTSHSHDTAGVGGFLATRDFSPKMSDLKRVASGILKPDANGLMRSTRADGNGAASSAASTTASIASFSTAEESASNLPGTSLTKGLTWRRS